MLLHPTPAPLQRASRDKVCLEKLVCVCVGIFLHCFICIFSRTFPPAQRTAASPKIGGKTGEKEEKCSGYFTNKGKRTPGWHSNKEQLRLLVVKAMLAMSVPVPSDRLHVGSETFQRFNVLLA